MSRTPGARVAIGVAIFWVGLSLVFGVPMGLIGAVDDPDCDVVGKDPDSVHGRAGFVQVHVRVVDRVLDPVLPESCWLRAPIVTTGAMLLIVGELLALVAGPLVVRQARERRRR